MNLRVEPMICGCMVYVKIGKLHQRVWRAKASTSNNLYRIFVKDRSAAIYV